MRGVISEFLRGIDTGLPPSNKVSIELISSLYKIRNTLSYVRFYFIKFSVMEHSISGQYLNIETKV